MAQPLRLGIAGISHGHVKTIDRRTRKDISVVGVYERDPRLLSAYGKQRGLSESVLFTQLDEMIAATKPEAVAAFGSIRDHLSVVEACAPYGIHVMVEKPLAVNPNDARRMAALANEYGIHVITNYETTWYASTHRANELVRNAGFGAIRKMVVHDGHRGPKEIGCSPEFLAWLTGSTEEGGGALIDFGCYGVNLATLLIGGTPEAVTAVAGHLKPDVYPKVEDDATIILSYPNTRVVIQASWNWPISRKDMEIYCESGVIVATDGSTVRTHLRGAKAEETTHLGSLPAPIDEPFTQLAAIVRGEHLLNDDDLSGLANNILVVDILDAAHRSARLGATVPFPQS